MTSPIARAEQLLPGYCAVVLLATIANVCSQRLSRQHGKKYEDFYQGLLRGDDAGDQVQGSQGAVEADPEERDFDLGLRLSRLGVFRYSPGGNILSYEHGKSISLRVLFVFKHTVLSVPTITKRLLVGTLVIVITCLWDVLSFVVSADKLPAWQLSDISRVSAFFTGFIAILLGFYLNTIFGRWWDVRSQTIGSLWGAVDDLTLLLAAHLPGHEWASLRKLVLRYSIVSFELTFMQAQGEDSKVDHLVGRSLLTAGEAKELKGLASKPQVVWTWVAALFRGLHQQGHVSDILLDLLYRKCLQARGGIGATFAYLDTQLPFMYVHLLAVIVHLTNLIAAMDAGISAAHFIMIPHEQMENGEEPKVMVKLLQFCMQCFFYNACLEIGRIFSDPLGTDFEDFPRYAYHLFMRSECEAFDTAGQKPPRAVERALAQLPAGADHSPCSARGGPEDAAMRATLAGAGGSELGTDAQAAVSEVV